MPEKKNFKFFPIIKFRGDKDHWVLANLDPRGYLTTIGSIWLQDYNFEILKELHYKPLKHNSYVLFVAMSSGPLHNHSNHAQPLSFNGT